MNVNRSSQQEALVLRVRPFGESHASVDLLGAEDGLIPAVAYGLRSRRSSLRGKVVPFARGEAWLYRDPRQERSKINDFAVDRYALDLQHDLTAYYHASLWAELAWRSHASGDTGAAAFQLLAEGLDLLQGIGLPERALTVSPEARARQVGLGVLWRYLALLGMQPDLDYCVVSERAFRSQEVRFYHSAEGGLVASEWSGPGMPQLPLRGVAFLRAAEERELAILTARALDQETLLGVRSVVLAAVQAAAEGVLNTLDVAGGFL